MKAVVAFDYSGIDALAYRDWPEPEPKPGEVLIRAVWHAARGRGPTLG